MIILRGVRAVRLKLCVGLVPARLVSDMQNAGQVSALPVQKTQNLSPRYNNTIAKLATPNATMISAQATSERQLDVC